MLLDESISLVLMLVDDVLDRDEVAIDDVELASWLLGEETELLVDEIVLLVERELVATTLDLLCADDDPLIEVDVGDEPDVVAPDEARIVEDAPDGPLTGCADDESEPVDDPDVDTLVADIEDDMAVSDEIELVELGGAV